jgi:hypothetical protein
VNIPLLVTFGPVEFEKQRVEVQGFRKFTDHFRGICGIYFKLIKKNQKITSCDWLDLKTLGFVDQVCPKNLRGHYTKYDI